MLFGQQNARKSLAAAKTKSEELCLAIEAIIFSGVKPGNLGREYILRKLLRKLNSIGGEFKHDFFYREKEKHLNMIKKYKNLLTKNPNKSESWWWETHGINVLDLK